MPERIYPRLEVFERLQISDGLAINAERWQHAHTYHRQRQNFQYQAIYQPGIVYGLGVATLPEQPDGRLLQIQPGVAIDVEGNPIVVPEPEEFRITSEAREGQALMVYLVVNYVDPDRLRRIPGAKTLPETFRILEKLHLDPSDVELCRIELQPGVLPIQAPVDGFQPGFNQLDFRGRCQPSPQPQLSLRVGQIDRVASVNGLPDLLRSLPGLYPALQAQASVTSFSPQALGRDAIDGQLLLIPYRVLLALPNPALLRLSSFLAAGGVLLVVADFAEVELLEFLDFERELRSGLAEAERDRDLFEQTGAPLQEELAAIQAAIAQRLDAIQQSLSAIAPKLGLSSGSGELHPDHPLHWQPFTFSQLPDRLGHPIQVKAWGGLVLMVGDLTCCWGRDAAPALSREQLRSAQEWGINLLHFAAQRHHWTQAMQPATPVTNDNGDRLQSRIHS